MSQVAKEGVDGCVVILQIGKGENGLPGKSLGAAQLHTAATN